jgi:hypothetical protein
LSIDSTTFPVPSSNEKTVCTKKIDDLPLELIC